MHRSSILVVLSGLLAACGKPSGPASQLVSVEHAAPVTVAAVTCPPEDRAGWCVDAVTGGGALTASTAILLALDRRPPVREEILPAPVFELGHEPAPASRPAAIDPERDRVALAQSEALATFAAGAVAEATEALVHRREAARENLVPPDEVQQARAKLHRAQADLDLARIAVERARLALRESAALGPVESAARDRPTGRLE